MARIRKRLVLVPKMVPVTLVYSPAKLKSAKRKMPVWRAQIKNNTLNDFLYVKTLSLKQFPNPPWEITPAMKVTDEFVVWHRFNEDGKHEE